MILFLVKSSSNGSRPPSTDKELYMPVTSMKYAKCAAGAVGFRGVFTFFSHVFQFHESLKVGNNTLQPNIALNYLKMVQ